MRPIVGGTLPATPSHRRARYSPLLVSSDAAVASEPAAVDTESPVGGRTAATGWIIVAVAIVAYLLPLRALLHSPGRGDGRGLHARLPRPCAARRGAQQGLPLPLRARQPVGARRGLQGLRHAPARRTPGRSRATRRHGRGRRHARALVGPRRSRSPRSLLNVVFVMPALQLTAIPVDGRRRPRAGRAGRVAAGAAHDTGVAGDTGARTLGGDRRRARRVRDVVPHRPRPRARPRGNAAAIWGCSRPVREAGIGRHGVSGSRPYLVHLATAGPGNGVAGHVDRPHRALAGRRATCRCRPTRTTSSAWPACIAAVDRSWPLPRLTPAQQLFVVVLVLLAVLALALVAFGVWCVRRDRHALRPRVLLAGALFGLGIFPQARAAGRLRAPRVGERTIVTCSFPAALAELVAMRPTGVAVVVGRPRRGRGGRSSRYRCSLPTYTARRYVEHGAGLDPSADDDRHHQRGPLLVRRRRSRASRTASNRCCRRSSAT